MFMLSHIFYYCCYTDSEHTLKKSLTIHLLAVHFSGTEKEPVCAINMTSPSRVSFI